MLGSEELCAACLTTSIFPVARIQKALMRFAGKMTKELPEMKGEDVAELRDTVGMTRRSTTPSWLSPCSTSTTAGSLRRVSILFQTKPIVSMANGSRSAAMSRRTVLPASRSEHPPSAEIDRATKHSYPPKWAEQHKHETTFREPVMTIKLFSNPSCFYSSRLRAFLHAVPSRPATRNPERQGN